MLRPKGTQPHPDEGAQAVAELKVDLRDIRFNLFDFLDAGALNQHALYKHCDASLLDDVLSMAYQQAREVTFPLWAQGDRVGLRFENGRVKTPQGWREAYKTYSEAGWVGLSLGVGHGGSGMSRLLHCAVQEIFLASNLSFCFFPGLSTGALGLISEFGTEDQRSVYLPKMLSGQWSGTMCLTEPQAGTAVPDLRTGATPIPAKPGFFQIKGQKIFITAGDHDLTDNIVHMVLARVDGDPPGTGGISLFMVPRVRPDGSFNDVTTVAVEEKMGIHASPTCQLAFGDEGGCEGWLLGKQGEGLKCMFKMMNESRIAVGFQGVALSNLAYQWALGYAKERVQGTRIEDMRKADAMRVAIIEHPDVRRMLMLMKAIGEGSRALALWAAYCCDKLFAAEHEGTDAKVWEHQLEILTPIVKAWCADEGFRATELGIQVLGGYGYIKEYGMEQLCRDAKIASLYEGTNGVQALDLLGRKISRGGGVMLMTMLNQINHFINGPAKEGSFADEVKELAKARDAVAKTSMSLGQRMMKGDVAYPVLHATPYLQMFGDLVVAWLLLRQAVVAEKLFHARLQKIDAEATNGNLGQVLAEDAEARYLHGKVATAEFFVFQVLPRVHAHQAALESGDRSALTVVL
jgi:alkylation response protein AidB-like acyl-CoA dehydrogenase